MPKRLAYAWAAMLLTGFIFNTGAGAAPVRYTLAPGTVQVGFRAYGLGIITIDGQFTRFGGTLTLDDANPAICQIELNADVASLRMPKQAMTDDALGADLLDAAHFPDFRYDATCTGNRLSGMLLLHGVSRTLAMDVERAPGVWRAAGPMKRADWGMGARPLIAGPEVRISITAGLPK